jgi:superfamily I DNA/RNA helicase
MSLKLSKEQEAVVLTESKKVLCLAGAGSGKTKTLVHRVNHLLENCHVSPYELILCTFTRKAGTEMKERLEKLVGPISHNIAIGTLHSVALRMIQSFGEMIGLNPGKITVYSSWEESVLLKDVCLELGYHTGKQFRKTTKDDVKEAFELFYTKKKRNERAYIPNEIMDAFFARCKENNALTYGMIMTSFLDLIPRIGHFLKFKHILVDEVQDLDPLQFRIINLIVSICDASLFIVGDDSQSIYGFRGADPGYLVRNQDKFDIYKLCDNYRSDGYIVEAANRLIKHNKNRLELEMNPIRDCEKEILHFPDVNSEKIINTIKFEHLKNSANTAVLGRNHFLLEKLSRLLQEAGIEHDYYGKKTKFTRSEEFRRVHALLILAVNPFDNFSFMLCLDYFAINREQYKSIRMEAVKNNKSHYQVFKEALNQSWAEEYFIAADDNNFLDVIEWMLGVDFKFDSIPVFDFIQEYIDSNHEPTIREYLDWLALYDVQDEITEESKKLQLMTIHASKGLEFSMVIIAGMNEGILPNFRANRDPAELESERRLAYVAYTRAKDHLILTSRPVDPEARTPQPVSRFIDESLKP